MIVTETIKYYFIAYLLVTVFASLHFLSFLSEKWVEKVRNSMIHAKI